MINSADDLIGATHMTPSEAAHVHEQLLLSAMHEPREISIEKFAHNFRLKPMLVARSLSEMRPDDQGLQHLIKTNEFLIKTFGRKRLSRDAVEGAMVITHKFWRNNDPLGVYKPGDMFYIDDNHPWMPYFPLMILAPSVFVAFLGLVATIVHTVVK